MRLSALLLCCVLLAPAVCLAQESSDPFPPSQSQSQRDDPQFHPRRNDEDLAQKMEKDQVKQRNLSRQKALQKDTERLLSLAEELKKYVDQTNENILSVDVIRKAEQIEKLARQVRDKMKAE